MFSLFHPPIPIPPLTLRGTCTTTLYYYPILIVGPTRGTSHACSQGKKEVEEWLSTEEKMFLFLGTKKGAFQPPFPCPVISLPTGPLLYPVAF
jgi:hypothetical protein